ncbi:hypothetical protein KGF56_003436 [Candida oxycetoniae]|uniref:Lipid droplet-associated hydrolase n=1 Tax=Candida oxycetoniae TaxID=497107 RepID=A0AAI9SVF7_9ASCO|nr:uncharacterized protein KGF56_003436 [Candida oxycetoniae]KAI3403801.2 hypothetical protein KGF56_003436 [Candida oxycetoniae]
MSIESSASDVAAAIYHKISTIPDSNDILIMIPGNPGLVEYYIPYLNLIQDSIAQFEIFCIGYLGFVKESTQQSQRTYSVQEQIDHKYTIIKQIVTQHKQVEPSSRSKPPSLYFLSHSLGSFIIQRTILKLFQDEELAGRFEIKFNGMITPTIYDIAGSESGSKFVKMMQWGLPFVGVAATLSMLASYIPIGIQEWILNWHFRDIKEDTIVDTGIGTNYGLDNSINATIQFINSPIAIKQCLCMAKDEMEVIDKSDLVNDWFFSNSNKQARFKNWIFFAQNDHWVSQDTRNYLLGKYKVGQDNTGPNFFEICQNRERPIMHAFCINQSEEFANITIDRLKKLCRELH